MPMMMTSLACSRRATGYTADIGVGRNIALNRQLDTVTAEPGHDIAGVTISHGGLVGHHRLLLHPIMSVRPAGGL